MKLKFPPTKTNISNLKKTNLLFYNQPKTNNYTVFNITDGVIGNFSVEKRNEMFINNLFVTPNNRRNNLGTQILNFIKILSKQNGLGGKMRVLSSLLGNETKNPPHIFYVLYSSKSINYILSNKVNLSASIGSLSTFNFASGISLFVP